VRPIGTKKVKEFDSPVASRAVEKRRGELDVEQSAPEDWTLNEDQLLMRRVVCAAIRNRKTGALICGARHHNCLQSKFCSRPHDDWEQGFIDQFHKFMSRETAWEVAERQSQIIRRCGGDEGKLFSENLY
jgi:hypothetical protein